VTKAPPERVEVDNGMYVRWLTVEDADDVARAVAESLDELRPWMPWADAQSADPGFQRERLRNHPQQRARREEWQYGIFGEDGAGMLGAIGLMTRRGPGTLEIGYWLRSDAARRGYMTNAARALTKAGLQVDGIDQMIIVCDEANLRSAAVPQRLGYKLERVETRAPEAPGETGRMQIWVTGRSLEPPIT
jgi:RimJ/RimL family protein N-acetyltransferase